MEDTKNNEMDISNKRLRPRRLTKKPVNGIHTADETMYEVSTQVIC